MEINDHQRLLLSGIIAGAAVHLTTVRAMLRLIAEEGCPPLDAQTAELWPHLASLLNQMQEGLEDLQTAWAVDDHRQARLPALVQAQRLRAGMEALWTFRHDDLEEERPLARRFATIALDAQALEAAVLDAPWNRRGGQESR